MDRRHVLHVNITITTADAALARGLEPKAPRPDLRLAAIRTLTEAGIRTGVLAAPIMPGINDDEASLRTLAAMAKAHGANWFGGYVLFLKSPTKEVFFDYLSRTHPELAGRYASTFGDHARPSREYHQKVDALLDSIREAEGLNRRALPYLPPDWEQGNQLSLPLR